MALEKHYKGVFFVCVLENWVLAAVLEDLARPSHV